MGDIKPIETVYNGYRFRSRLEARWAIFFDALGIKYEYEREGFDLGESGWYLPDFWIPCASEQYPGAGYWIEIKGRDPTPQEKDKTLALAKGTKHTTWLVSGLPGEHAFFFTHNSGNSGYFDDSPYEGISEPAVFALWCSFATRFNLTYPEVKRACIAARSARFEHGETP